MKRDPLEQLLRQADEQAGEVSTLSGHEIAGRAWGRRQRGRRVRAGSAVAVVALLCSTVWLVLPRWDSRQVARPERPQREKQVAPLALNQDPPAPPAARGDEARARRERLADADVWEAVGARLAASARARERSRGMHTDGRLRLQLEQEQAALVLLYQGDRLAKDPELREPATIAYRQASEMFPHTHGAAAARQRLEAIN